MLASSDLSSLGLALCAVKHESSKITCGNAWIDSRPQHPVQNAPEQWPIPLGVVAMCPPSCCCCSWWHCRPRQWTSWPPKPKGVLEAAVSHFAGGEDASNQKLAQPPSIKQILCKTGLKIEMRRAFRKVHSFLADLMARREGSVWRRKYWHKMRKNVRIRWQPALTGICWAHSRSLGQKRWRILVGTGATNAQAKKPFLREFSVGKVNEGFWHRLYICAPAF